MSGLVGFTAASSLRKSAGCGLSRRVPDEPARRHRHLRLPTSEAGLPSVLDDGDHGVRDLPDPAVRCPQAKSRRRGSVLEACAHGDQREHAEATRETIMTCKATYLGARCERDVDARGKHHGAHSADGGSVRWGDTESRDCDGACADCNARQREYLEQVAKTGQPSVHSRPWKKLQSGEWAAEDVKAWARMQLAERHALPSVN